MYRFQIIMTPSPPLSLPVRRFALAGGEGKGDLPHKRLLLQVRWHPPSQGGVRGGQHISRLACLDSM
jgi:hypothetical protein